MGLFSTVIQALGLSRDPEVSADDGLGFSAAAIRRLQQLDAQTALLLDLLPAQGGWMVSVHEATTDEPGHAELPGRVVVDPRQLDRMQGLELDVADGRWRVRTRVKVVARETPNPDSRLFLTDRTLSSGRLSFAPVDRDQASTPRLAQRVLEHAGVASLMVRGNTLTVERAAGVPWPAIDQAIKTAVQEHLLFCGGVLTPREHHSGDDPLLDEIRALLEAEVLPALHKDGGDLDVIDLVDGVLRVVLVGACRTCPASALTLSAGVQRAVLAAFPGEVDSVLAIDPPAPRA